MDFKELTIEELLHFVNSRLENGLSLVNIAKELNVNESSIRKKLNNNGYKREGKKFVLQDVGRSVTYKDIPKVDKCDQISVVQKGGDVGQVENKENFITLMNNFDIIMEMVERYKNNNVVHTGGIVVQLPFEENKTYKTSLRINKTVLDQFKEFCNEHKEFSQKDLLSMALVEYMNNHK